MKKWIIIGIIALFILAGGGFVAKNKIFAKGGKNGKDAAPTRTAMVTRGNLSVTVNATGTIEPLTIVEVKSKASGKIIKLHVDRGDYLNAGDPMIEIETKYTARDVEQAKADLSSAKARLAQAETNIELQKKQVEIQIVQAKINLAELATKRLQLKDQISLERLGNQRQLEDTRNSLESAKLRHQVLVNPRPEDIKRAEASVDQAKSDYDLAQKDNNRLIALKEKGYVSQADVDNAKTKAEKSKAQHYSLTHQLEVIKNPRKEEIEIAKRDIIKAELAIRAAEEKIELQKAREKDLEVLDNQIEEAKKALELAEANKAQITLKEKDLETAQAQLLRSKIALTAANDRMDDTRVEAPISGTILQKNVEEGQVITSSISSVAAATGMTMFTMADLSQVYVKTDVDETDIGKVEIGQPVKITVDAYPEQSFEGVVLKIAPQGKTVQNVTSFEVTTEIKNISAILKPGMNASVEIIAADKQEVLLVPNEAIQDFMGRKMVFAMVKGGEEGGKESSEGEGQRAGGGFQRAEGGIASSEQGGRQGGERRSGQGQGQGQGSWQGQRGGQGGQGGGQGGQGSGQWRGGSGGPGGPGGGQGRRSRTVKVTIDGVEQTFAPRPIQTGTSNFEFSEVISGLGEGDLVVLGNPLQGQEQNPFAQQMRRDPSSAMRMQRMMRGNR